MPSDGDIFQLMGRRCFGGTTVKRPAAPATAAHPAPKKLAAQPNGPSKGQPAAATATAPPTEDAPPTEKPPPPFFVDATADWPELAAKLKELTSGDFSAIARGGHIRVRTSTVANFRAVQRYLCTNNIAFHTFTVGKRRCRKVVISGLPSTVTDVEVADALGEQGFAVELTTRLRSRRGRSNRWLATMVPDKERDEGDRRADEIYRVAELLHLRVTVEPYKKPPGPPQCHHCQGFGHGSGNCGRPQKCVRCGGPHNAYACKRPASEKGHCCNCEGDHNANWRGCPAFAAAKIAAAPRPAKRDPGPRNRRQRRQSPPPTTVKTMACTEEEPSPDQVVEESTTEDEDGFESVRRRRKRKPRNPANRGERAADQAPSQRARPTQPRAPPAQRATPRPRLDWPPTPAPAPEQPTPAAADTAATPVAAIEGRAIFAAIAEIAAQLTELTKLVSALASRQ